MRIVTFILLVLFPFNVFATDYYVSKSGGSDSNDGLTTATPWQCVVKVNATAFSPDDNIYFKRGDAWTRDGSCTTSLVNESKGTAGHRITYADYGTGALPILDMNNGTNLGVFIDDVAGNFYITYKNLEIKNALQDGLKIGNTGEFLTSYQIIIDGVYSHNNGRWGIDLQSSDHVVKNSEVSLNDEDGIWWQGNNVEIGPNNYVHHNDQQHNLGDALQAGSGTVNSGWYVHDNVLQHPGTGLKGIFVAEGSGDAGIFERNICTGGQFGIGVVQNRLICRRNLFSGQKAEAMKVFMDSPTYENNIAINVESMFESAGSASGTVTISNNTGYHIFGQGFNFAFGSFTANAVNNLFYLTTNADGMIAIAGITMNSDYNLYYPESTAFITYHGTTYNTLVSFASATGIDTHSLAVDPQLDGLLYQKLGSPVIDAGTVSSTAVDYTGATRPVNLVYDIGAFEYSGGEKFFKIQKLSINGLSFK